MDFLVDNPLEPGFHLGPHWYRDSFLLVVNTVAVDPTFYRYMSCRIEFIDSECLLGRGLSWFYVFLAAIFLQPS